MHDRIAPVVIGVVVVAVLAAAPARGAKLELLDRQVIRYENGERVPVAEERVQPADSSMSTAAATSLNNQTQQPQGASGVAIAVANFEIEPDAGEAIGDCVQVDYRYTATATATATGTGDAAAGVGGDGGFTASFLPVVLTIDEPARITIDPSGTPEVVFQFGPEIVEPGDADLDEELSGSFSTTIGETLELTVLSAAVAEAFPGDTASAAAASQLEVELQLCPVSVLEIPTTDGRGLGFLLLALAVAGLFAVRRLRMG